MPFLLVSLVCLLGAAVHPADSTRLHTRLHIRANPIRKVITMLQKMEEKAKEEGDERTKLYDKFVCYCKVTDADLDKSISKAQDRIPQIESNIKKDSAEKQQLHEELKQQKSELKELKRAIQTAVAVRDETRAGLIKDQRFLEQNVQALGKAIKQIQKGSSSNLLQSDRTVLKQISSTVDVPAGDRDELIAFLEGHDQSSDSGMILGIMKQMHETMEADLAKVTNEVADLDKKYEKLLAAQSQEAEALEVANMEKIRRHGEAAVKLATMDAELDDLNEGLEEDLTFRKDLEASCNRKKSEWDEYQKMYAEELVAFSETIRLLGQDGAMETFKKSLPKREESFMQMGVSSKEMRRQALNALRRAATVHHGHRLTADPRVDLLELAIHGEKVGFDKVVEKIDGLIAILGEEQKEDDKKKAFCESETRKIKEELRQGKRSVKAKEAVVDDGESDFEDLAASLKQLASGIKSLDKQVAEATKERKAENAKNKEELAANNAAVNLLDLAIGKLTEFYRTETYEESLLEMHNKRRRGFRARRLWRRVQHSTSAPDFSDGSMSLLQEQVTRRIQRSSAPPEPPPEVDLKYQRQDDHVTGLMYQLKHDLVSRASELQTEEKISQADYMKFVKDAAEKRALDSKAFSNNELAKADLESALHEDRESLTSLYSDMEASQKTLKGLHDECDWLLAQYDLRREARAREKEALQDAHAVLSGEDLDL